MSYQNANIRPLPSNFCGIGVGRDNQVSRTSESRNRPQGMCEFNARQRRHFHLEKENSLLPSGAGVTGYPSGKKIQAYPVSYYTNYKSMKIVGK